MVACKYGISLLVLNSKRNSISTRANVLFSIYCAPNPPPHVLFSIYHAPPPHTIREKVRQYNHNFSLELPHYIYISIPHLKYSLQKFGFVHVNYVNEHKNSGTKSFQTKTIGAKNTLKPNALNIAY